jgi:hypothetical protein
MIPAPSWDARRRMHRGLEGRALRGRKRLMGRSTQAAGLTAPAVALPRSGTNKTLMDTFLIDVPMPSMGATVNELTVVSLKIQAGARVAKGQKIGELESDKSIFEFESPCDGTVRAILPARRGRPSGAVFLQIGDLRREPAAPASKSGPLRRRPRNLPLPRRQPSGPRGRPSSPRRRASTRQR